MSSPLRIAVLGLGESGLAIATGLLTAGADVIAFDVKPPKKASIPLADSVEAAVTGADLVLSITTSTQAWRMAQDAATHLGAGVLYADFTTGTPAHKVHLAKSFAEGSCVDVAIMGSAAEQGAQVPLLVAGAQAQAFIDLVTPLGMNAQPVSDRVGDAAARQVIQGLLAKNLAGVVVDYMWAAESMGVADWAFDSLQREFEAMTGETARNYLIDTVKNAKRREIEMMDVVEMLEGGEHQSLFVPPTQLVYNKIYHSIKVPHSDEPEDD
jgi:putative dehydrogenase